VVKKPDARTFGQDLMRGEHVVGKSKYKPTMTSEERVVANKVGSYRDQDKLNQIMTQKAPIKKRNFTPHVGLFEELSQKPKGGALGERFLMSPFTILNAREGWWQDRKRAWLELGIKSELGRGNDAAPGGSKQCAIDPVTGKICRADSKGRPIAGTVAKVHTATLAKDGRAGLTFDTTTDPYRSKANGAIAGAKVGSGKNAFKFKTADGYKSGTEINQSRQTASLKGGLTVGTTIHPYDDQEGGDASATGTSIFDPVLCELAYRWFSPPGGLILDPFAGGSVRGIVAAKQGRKYIGIDLQKRQLEANFEQGEEICTKGDPKPDWRCGDSRDIAKLVKEQADFIFTCPPYADLERYSDDPKDLSTLGYEEFRKVYTEIIKAACSRLKPNRFACFVVGDVRGKDGNYYNFPGHTVEAFAAAGLKFYNEAILVTAVGSLPVRASRQFEVARKLGKTHQNVYVFLKGDAKLATKACGPLGDADFAA